MKRHILQSLKMILLMTLLLGVAYPALMTLVAAVAFPHASSGSVIMKDGKAIGSELIGQKFESPKYFHSRPSAVDFQPMPSGGSNYGPTSKQLQEQVCGRHRSFIVENGLDSTTAVPNDVLFASASGVDPHISPEAALLQVTRVSRTRGYDSSGTTGIRSLVDKMTEGPQWGVFGNPRVNVLRLNLALDALELSPRQK
ncbi:MAG: potassium-transporting ATPase subunit KdpC [Ignavibacteriales bacterium]|nr:potassium-transporting ATPase subunit KdpC [Ignavibacteriales bacterium]